MGNQDTWEILYSNEGEIIPQITEEIYQIPEVDHLQTLCYSYLPRK